MIFESRPYVDDSDYAAIHRLIRSLWRKYGAPQYTSVGELDYWRALDGEPDLMLRARLWQQDGEIIGAALPSSGRVDLLVDPATPDLIEAMQAWAEANQRDTIAHSDQPAKLGVWCFEGDTARLAMLQARGYRRQEVCFFYRGRSLDDPFPPPRPAPGYRLSDLRHSPYLGARIDVHHQAFASTHLTPAKYQRAQNLPTYRADLDLVMIAPDESFAAFALVWFDQATHTGVFEPVGTHPAHQRMGLGRATIFEGLRRLRDLGAREVYVSAFYDNFAATGLYKACGFATIDRLWLWEKAL